jgi:hypothetical protein
MRGVLLAVGLLVTAAGCGDPQQPQTKPTAAVYQAILDEMVAEHVATTTTATAGGRSDRNGRSGTSREDDDAADATLLPVFVEPLGEGYVIDLAVQADVIRGLEDVADVRFIDQRTEALEQSSDGQPVRDGGMLVALGPLLEEVDGIQTVQVRRYIDADRSENRRAVVTESEGSWVVELS